MRTVPAHLRPEVANPEKLVRKSKAAGKAGGSEKGNAAAEGKAAQAKGKAAQAKARPSARPPQMPRERSTRDREKPSRMRLRVRAMLGPGRQTASMTYSINVADLEKKGKHVLSCGFLYIFTKYLYYIF